MYSVVFFILGLLFGSFMNVLISRLPYGESVIYPGSKCPKCDHKIRFYENIPIISYILLKGKCSECKEKISIQYPLVELITGISFLLVYKYFGLTLLAIKMFVFVFLLLVIAFTDYFTSLDTENFECGVIPVILTRGGILLGFIMSFIVNPSIKTLYMSFLGLIIGGLIIWLPGFIYQLITKKEGMGFGDVELFAMIGAFVGYKPLFLILMLSSLFGTVVGIPVIAIKKDKNFPIPFGPFISLATIVYIFYGEALVRTYINTMYK